MIKNLNSKFCNIHFEKFFCSKTTLTQVLFNSCPILMRIDQIAAFKQMKTYSQKAILPVQNAL